MPDVRYELHHDQLMGTCEIRRVEVVGTFDSREDARQYMLDNEAERHARDHHEGFEFRVRWQREGRAVASQIFQTEQGAREKLVRLVELDVLKKGEEPPATPGVAGLDFIEGDHYVDSFGDMPDLVARPTIERRHVSGWVVVTELEREGRRCVMSLFLAGLSIGLAVAACAAFAASRAHQRHAITLREMADTWGAIERAQRKLRHGQSVAAGVELKRAEDAIRASRRRRGVA